MRVDLTTTVNFDEIGYKEHISVGKGGDAKIIATVKSEGPFKILLVTPSLDSAHLTRELRYCTEFINEQLFTLQDFSDTLQALAQAIEGFRGPRRNSTATFNMIDQQFPLMMGKMKQRQAQLLDMDQELNPASAMQLSHNHAVDVANEVNGRYSTANPGAATATGTGKVVTDLSSYKPFERALPAGINHTHQLLVEVLEAKDLTPFVVGKTEDTYCKVFLKSDDLIVKAE
jgi:hypothetical protein